MIWFSNSCVDVLAAANEEAKKGAYSVLQVPNVTGHSVDTLRSLRPPQQLTDYGTAFARDHDSVSREGHHHDWWCRVREREKPSVSLIGGTQSPLT